MDSEDEIQQQYNANNYYSENDSELVTEDSRSVSTFNLVGNRKKYNKRLDDLKMADNGYYKETRIVDETKVRIEMYSSPSCQGHLIRDAVTGETRICRSKITNQLKKK